MTAGGRRSTKEIRSSLAENRHRLEEDLEDLEARFEDSLSPRHLFSRHPVIVSLAGALVGVFVVRRPTLVLRSVGRLAQLGAPLVLKTLLKRNESSSAGLASRDDADGHHAD